MRRKNHEFYKRSVLPFAPYEESVDYELLVCFDPTPSRVEIKLSAAFGGFPGKGCSLWKSHELSLLKTEPFAAVGVGAATAKALLSKLWISTIPLEMAVSLAGYVAYQVKRTVKDVGLDTDILVIRRNYIPLHVETEEISEMEAKFAEYENVERESLYYCLGGNLAEREQYQKVIGNHKLYRKSLRRFFEKLNSDRLKRWQPPSKPLGR